MKLGYFNLRYGWLLAYLIQDNGRCIVVAICDPNHLYTFELMS